MRALALDCFRLMNTVAGMAIIIIIAGLLLIIAGAGFFLATGSQAVSSLIPAFLGLPIALCGGLMCAMHGPGRRHLAHAAAMCALLGVLGGLGMGLPGLFKLIGGTAGVRPAAVALQLIMGVICAVLMVLMVRSFIQARRQRNQTPAA